MIPALSIGLGLLALASLVFWILAVRTSYRIERLRQPDLPKPRMIYTNIFATAFWTPPAANPAEKKLQSELRTRLIAALSCLLVMAGFSFVLPLLSVEKPSVATAPAGPPPVHAVGTTLSYIRSNQSGTEPETILVHIPAPNEIHVAKMVAVCTDAAYVTATVDPAANEATALIGGRLQRDGTQLPQAFLTLDPARKLIVRFGAADAESAETPDAPPAPWRMYDFDLAEFSLLGPREPKSFTFGLAIAWPDGPPPACPHSRASEREVPLQLRQRRQSSFPDFRSRFQRCRNRQPRRRTHHRCEIRPRHRSPLRPPQPFQLQQFPPEAHRRRRGRSWRQGMGRRSRRSLGQLPNRSKDSLVQQRQRFVADALVDLRAGQCFRAQASLPAP